MAEADRIRIEFDGGGDIAETTIDAFRAANADLPEMIEAACAALDRDEVYRDGGGAGPGFTIIKIGDPIDPPDVSEFVEAIRETVEAGDAFNTAHPDLEYPDSDAGLRWRAAFDRLRKLLSDCDHAMEAFGS